MKIGAIINEVNAIGLAKQIQRAPVFQLIRKTLNESKIIILNAIYSVPFVLRNAIGPIAYYQINRVIFDLIQQFQSIAEVNLILSQGHPIHSIMILIQPQSLALAIFAPSARDSSLA